MRVRVDHRSHGCSTFFGASADESAAAFSQCSSPAQAIVMRALVGCVVCRLRRSRHLCKASICEWRRREWIWCSPLNGTELEARLRRDGLLHPGPWLPMESGTDMSNSKNVYCACVAPHLQYGMWKILYCPRGVGKAQDLVDLE
jgi:hypothetical protein